MAFHVPERDGIRENAFLQTLTTRLLDITLRCVLHQMRAHAIADDPTGLTLTPEGEAAVRQWGTLMGEVLLELKLREHAGDGTARRALREFDDWWTRIGKGWQ